ncbi:MAG: endonuclease/exonuclease/phosphatase family protein [Prevotella sp.]|nr:endonuclease/exonuclease/phosphatase family protein [Prevotella sp.]
MKKTLFTLFTLFILFSCSKPMYLNVMTFNVRFDYAGDGPNNWQYRKDVAAKVVDIYDVDIMGGQEVLNNQLKDLLERLPEYGAIGVGRDDGLEKGEFSPLLYKKNRFTEEKSGTFWISETPDIAGSTGWDAACNRIASWAILKDKKSGKRIFAINTHLDHMGLTARKEGANLLIAKINELADGLPVVLTGDFNDLPASDAVKNITDITKKGYLTDSKSIASKVSGSDWTFHDFGRLPTDKRERIDYIFVNKQVKVSDYEVLQDTLDSVFVSDHKPVYTKLSIK